MVTRLKIGVYWGPARQDSDAMARAVMATLDGLALASAALSGWREGASTLVEAVANPTIDGARIASLVDAGSNHDEIDGSVLTHLGRSLSLWNGRDDESGAKLSITSGITAEVDGLLNVAHLTAGLDGDDAASREVLDVLAKAWRPSYGVVTTRMLRQVRTWEPRRPVVGWFTYLGPDRPRPTTTIGAVTEGPNGGCIVRAAEDLADVDVDLLTRLTAELDAAGARNPIPTTLG